MRPADWMAFLLDIADRTDPIALRHFRRPDLAVETKPDRTPVTEADRAIERAVRERAARHPDRPSVFGEEYGQDDADAPLRLIVDPIDATRNFARGIPVFATLLAVERDGEILAGVASAPGLGTRWCAARGAGAWEDGRRLRVSPTERLADAQFFHGSLAGVEGPSGGDAVLRLARATARQRGFGDFYQHCLVAAGRGEVALDFGLQPWDVAALQVLVEEAGGRISDLRGRRTVAAGDYLATNGRLHAEALDLLARPPDA